MKHLSYTFIVITVIYLCSCKSSEEVTKFHPYTAKDFITVKLKLYEVDPKCNLLLDSLILAVEECPRLQGKTNCFIAATFYRDSILELVIESRSPKRINYGWDNNLLRYKGYSFYWSEEMPKSLFTFKNEYVDIRGVDPEKFMYNNDFYEEEKNLSWWYSYENNELRNVGYINCEKTYFPAQE